MRKNNGNRSLLCGRITRAAAVWSLAVAIAMLATGGWAALKLADLEGQWEFTGTGLEPAAFELKMSDGKLLATDKDGKQRGEFTAVVDGDARGTFRSHAGKPVPTAIQLDPKTAELLFDLTESESVSSVYVARRTAPAQAAKPQDKPAETKTAVPPPDPGEDSKSLDWTPPMSLTADLDGDGRPETISLKKTPGSGPDSTMGEMWYLVVLDDDGTELWTSPKTKDPGNPLAFGQWDYGECMPEVVGDVDGDGKVELMATGPQSDVSVRPVKMLRWTEGAFRLVKQSSLPETAPTGSDIYGWGDPSRDPNGRRWISRFFRVRPDGKSVVEITDYAGGTQVKNGKAVIEPTAKGFHVANWILKLTPAEEIEGGEKSADEKKAEPAEPKADPAKPGASGGKPTVTYMCQLGPEDMRNAKGEALTSLNDILAQDRANFHRYKIRHRRDIPDETYFASANNRLLFQKLPVECSQELRKTIAAGWATVVVSVFPDKIVVAVDQD